MSFYKLTALACAALTLGACSSLFQPDLHKPLQAKRDAWEHIKPGCSIGADCPLVNIDTLHFPDEPQLDALVQQRLLQMTRNAPNAPVAPTLQAYEAQFLSKADSRYSSYLQAKVREQHDGLVIIELSSYLDEGGAHGTPGRGFINWSRQQHKALTLQDMLLPGQEEAFWKAAEEAHRGWLKTVTEQGPNFARDWPFQKTPNIALTYGGVILKYDVYSIAPYAMGHPEIKIDYPRLNGVIKPQLFPGRG
ncbi:RsiV family protein [Pseudomonas sp. HR96]|uniref:RsiV family protein n=1 Tax=Pseudomonas sp. HR96 TaxID=1027966 RepID=UPI002A7554CD|nr:RsiV family protein [Pseudomonas sp. HR96]WPO99555.1 RsiV family protein [Pseudomonas sp. HR96]